MSRTNRYISSVSNSEIKQLVRLREKNRTRKETGLFLVEGYRETKRALAASVNIEKAYFCTDWFLGNNEDELLQQLEDQAVELIELSYDAFKKISYRDRPDGLIVVAKQWDTGLERFHVKGNEVFAVVEAIEKPGNLGTLMRGCDATGVDGLIICNPVSDIYNPNCVRASTGALFSVPIAVVEESQTAVNWLKDNGVRIISTTPHTDNLIWDEDLSAGSIALVAGAEQYGLSETWLDQSDKLVKLPMNGQADSLNIATSSIVCLYETLRQRSV